MSFQIDKNVPMAKRKSEKTGVSAVLRSLQVGDSFLVGKGVASTNAHYMLAKAIGIRISCRAEGDCVRVWRIA